MSACGAGTGSTAPREAPPQRAEMTVVLPGEVPGFTAVPAPPDTVAVQWSRPPATVSTMSAMPGDSISAGDTLLSAADSLAALQLDLAAMSLAIARARFEASGGAEEAAGLAAAESTFLEASGALDRALLSPASGEVLWLPAPGTVLEPPDTAALLLSGGALLLVRPPAGFTPVHWPDSMSGAALVEVLEGYALYSGEAPRGVLTPDGAGLLPRRALMESGLRTFVIMEGGDTLDVRPLFACSTGVIAAAELPPGAGVLAWVPESDSGGRR